MENFPPLFEQLVGRFAAVIGSAPTADSFLAVGVGMDLVQRQAHAQRRHSRRRTLRAQVT